MILDAGIIDGDNYTRLLRDPMFLDMEAYSDGFVQSNQSVLAPYGRKWVSDPLHQWSRQWEYPFALSRIEAFAGTHAGTVRVLDAGSGITFFPYYLSSRAKNLDVTCCDFDGLLAGLYATVNKGAESPVRFTPGDLKKVPFDDDAFDLIYCVSVIEHLDNFDSVLDEFSRVLRPGGRLVLTFDIALDGVSDIAPATAQKLLDSIDARFASEIAIPVGGLDELLSAPSLLTTRRVQETGAGVLPWSLFSPRRFRPLLRFRMPGIPVLTVFCGAFQNKKPLQDAG